MGYAGLAQMLPRSTRRVFAAIERTISDGRSVSYTDFRLDHHIARKAVSPSLKLLDHLGLLEIEPGHGLSTCSGPLALY
jgi:hypothetical protein